MARNFITILLQELSVDHCSSVIEDGIVPIDDHCGKSCVGSTGYFGEYYEEGIGVCDDPPPVHGSGIVPDVDMIFNDEQVGLYFIGL